MKLPWVARTAYDAVCAERDRERERLDGLLDHFKRVERREAGLSEVPIDPKPREPVPQRVRELFRAQYESAGAVTRDMQWRAVQQLYDRLGDWDAVYERMADGA